MKNISVAIQAVMTEINWVDKSMEVWKWTNAYKWVSDKDVRQLLRTSMVKNWLSIMPTDVQSKIQVDRWEEADSYNNNSMKSKQSVFTEVMTKYILLHTSGESIILAWYWQGVDTQDKWAGKATTYALKNTLLNMFLIPTGVDTENTHSDEYDVPKNTPKATTTPPQKQTYTGSNKTAWFNKKELEMCIAQDNAFSKEAIEQWAIDNWYKLSWPSRVMIDKYLNSWEL